MNESNRKAQQTTLPTATQFATVVNILKSTSISILFRRGYQRTHDLDIPSPTLDMVDSIPKFPPQAHITGFVQLVMISKVPCELARSRNIHPPLYGNLLRSTNGFGQAENVKFAMVGTNSQSLPATAESKSPVPCGF